MTSRPSSLFSMISGIIVVCFIAATGVVHVRLTAIDRSAVTIAESVAPGIEHLTSARAEAAHVQQLLRSDVERARRGEPLERRAVAGSLRSLNRSFARYLALPLLASEAPRAASMLRSKEAFDMAIARVLAALDARAFEAADRLLDAEVRSASAALGSDLTQTMDLNARQAGDFASHIHDVRDRSARIAIALDIICTLIAAGGVLLLRRAMRERAKAEEQARRLEQEHVAELEHFAGRVAHDILSPLGTVGFALEIAAGASDEARRRELVARGTAALARVKRLVGGLLDFARAGGAPEHGGRADVRSVVDDLAKELTPVAREVGAELTVELDPAVGLVACHAGVLTSLVANLARNALKYIGDGEIRRVTIRAIDKADAVRVEVEDTGPGLPLDLAPHVFEPYVRGGRTRQPGMGLGLATVKRLAEAHGGKVGVRSVPGDGATFWFVLPKATPNADADRVASGELATA